MEIIDKKKFSMMVEERVRDNVGVGYMDAIIALCDENNIDLSDTGKIINKIIKQKLEAEAIQLNYLKGGNQLPI